MTLDSTVSTAPPRGTRPPNRRALIIAVAADLFARNGYEQVAMSEVAEAVNVRPSALYRHFKGKQQLLAAAVRAEMLPFQRILATATPEAVVPELARAALDHRGLGPLWQRESRNLPAEERTVLRREIRATTDRFSDVVRALRPDVGVADAGLLSWCAWSALCSVSYHSMELPRAQYEQLLRSMTLEVLFTPCVGDVPEPGSGPARFSPVARREKLLTAALTLFAERGYATVSMEDIGSRAGLAAASIYYHFGSKHDLLAAAVTRADEWVRYDMYRALASATDTREALLGLLASCVDFVFERSEVIDVLIIDNRYLNEGERKRVSQSQRDYIGEWKHLLRTLRPEVDAATARILVQAAISIAGDIARTPHLRDQPRTRAIVKQAGQRLLLGVGGR